MPLASIPSPSQGVWYLGPLPLRAYALCIVLGVVLAVWLSERRWRARGGTPGTMIDIAVPAVVFGLIGGRLYHVITDWKLYFGPDAVHEPYQALFIWNGGLGIWGAVALGGVGVWLACRKRGLSLGAVADTIAPGLAFAQAIGRWGNWFNQELYGSPTTLPWGLEIDIQHGGEPGVLYHPTFLYESLWNVALGFVLLYAGKRFSLHYGRLFMLYVAGYTLGRFWIEGLRIDPVGGVDHAVEFLGLRLNQWTAIVLFVGAVVLFWATRKKDGVEIVVSPHDELPGSGGSAAEATDSDSAEDSADSDSADSAGADSGGTDSGGADAPRGSTDRADSDRADDNGMARAAAAEGASPDPAHPADQSDDEPKGAPRDVAGKSARRGTEDSEQETRTVKTEDSEQETQAVREEEKNSR